MAALGGSVDSVEADRAHLSATLRVTAAESYTVHELQAPSGTRIREYAASSGTVFAVAWNGPSLPDLQQILGTYFGPYVEAAKAKHRGHGPLLLREPGLVVHSSGHVRAFSGVAYVPELMPAGVSVQNLQ